MREVIVIRYDSWMNWCQTVGFIAIWGGFLQIGVFEVGNFHIPPENFLTPFGVVMALGLFEIVVTHIAKNRFRVAAIRSLIERGVDLKTQPVEFR